MCIVRAKKALPSVSSEKPWGKGASGRRGDAQAPAQGRLGLARSRGRHAAEARNPDPSTRRLSHCAARLGIDVGPGNPKGDCLLAHDERLRDGEAGSVEPAARADVHGVSENDRAK